MSSFSSFSKAFINFKGFTSNGTWNLWNLTYSWRKFNQIRIWKQKVSLDKNIKQLLSIKIIRILQGTLWESFIQSIANIVQGSRTEKKWKILPLFGKSTFSNTWLIQKPLSVRKLVFSLHLSAILSSYKTEWCIQLKHDVWCHMQPHKRFRDVDRCAN